MKAFQITSSGMGKQLFLAETAEGAIQEFRNWIEHCDKLNGEETPASDTVITAVRRVGAVINHKA